MPVEVQIMMGVPGAGKNHFIENNMPRPNLVVSADDFFMQGDEYKFDPKLLGKAHADCFRKTVAYLKQYEGLITRATVVVNNTNTTIAEIAPYMAAAGAYGADASIICFRIDPVIAAARNVHGVSVKTVTRMAETIERTLRELPSWWEHEVLDWDPSRADYRIQLSKTVG